jgi:hypothetical protein
LAPEAAAAASDTRLIDRIRAIDFRAKAAYMRRISSDALS